MLTFFISSCKNKLENENIFPDVKNVTALKNTDFVPTLESSFQIENNNIYAATIPLTWNEIRTEIGTTLTHFSSKQLKEINSTKSYLDVLKENAYDISAEVDGTEVNAKAIFRKSLPFDQPLTKFSKPLTFGNSKVESFGFWGNCEFAKINYYTNENEFSISLFPKDKEHEIILIMDKRREKSFKNHIQNYYQRKELQKNKRIHFNTNDKVEIPILEFNLEKSFDHIIDSTFKSNDTTYTMLEAYQRNAFILNENGAEVESVVEVAADATEELTTQHPKMMLFNKPFVILLKRKDAKNPYFGIYIFNEELLKKV
ncbi:hypothetical protein HNV08_00015 [Winogradskyella eckloniae]|uniref:hypothetical protein n=1 Tax=Winogradskyella eckloniae TaxID=1089306 RepID=UPI00156363F0|nr:hypothetical protein [Winogradskyella eckloniae]NRD18414.1 hypothetical protein [Winogradskyella eckloniae]